MMMQHGRTFDKDLKLFIDEALIVIRKEREKMRLEEIRLEKIKLEEINALKKASEEKKIKKFSIKKSFKNLKEMIVNQGRSLIKKVSIKTPKIINNENIPDIIIPPLEITDQIQNPNLNDNINESLPPSGFTS